MELSLIREIILNALQEDIGKGDITTQILTSFDDIPGKTKAKIVAKSEGVLAGIEVAKEVFRLLDPETEFNNSKKDGESFLFGDMLLELEASPRALLEGERVALNFLQRLSGIATFTRKFVEVVSPYGVKILDTRKTTPNLRKLEKYAVRMGGGLNHRFSLDGGIILKDNHIKLVGGVKKAVKLVKENLPPLSKIEVEISSLGELQEAIESGVDVIMLDNLDYNELEKAVQIIRSQSTKIVIEISGQIDLQNVEKIAKLKPDFISIGKLTHSVASLDMSMELII